MPTDDSPRAVAERFQKSHRDNLDWMLRDLEKLLHTRDRRAAKIADELTHLQFGARSRVAEAILTYPTRRGRRGK